MRKPARNPDVLSGLFFLLLGMGIIGFSSTIEIGSFDNPGPGLFPLLSGIILLFLSISLVIRAEKLPQQRIFHIPKGGYIRVFGLPIAMILYAISVDYFGFVLTTTFLLVYFLRYISKYPWKSSTLYALLISICAYLIFNSFLDVGLPSGLTGLIKI